MGSINALMRLGIGFVIVGFIANVGIPILFFGTYEADTCPECNSDAQEAMDNNYEFFSKFPLILGIVMIIGGIAEVVRRDEEG